MSVYTGYPLPAERIAFPADLFDTHEPPKAVQLLAMRTLATQVSRLKLEVDTLAPCMGARTVEPVSGGVDRARQPESLDSRRDCGRRSPQRILPFLLSRG